MLCIYNSLPWLGIEIYVSNIAISFIAILCAKMSRMNKALQTYS